MVATNEEPGVAAQMRHRQRYHPNHTIFDAHIDAFL